MQNIPLQAMPNQTLTVQLNSQNVQINVYTTAYGTFMDVYSGGNLIIAGVQCENQNRIVRDVYLGFQGDFSWYDTTGAGTDPYYTGFGTTYTLTYLSPSDLASLGLSG
jgi:hypothetical protein